ncbi:MAG TPA: cytochrome P450 [Myxococcales bacterium]|nr:cytochrome P450 [Myxococcales bacterium]
MLSLADILDLRARNPAPGPRGHPLLGSLPEVRRDPIRMFLQAFHAYGDVVRFRFGPMVGHLVSSPDGVNHVLAENNKNYGKQTRGYRNLRYVLGNGLLTSEGEFWRRQRRIAQPAFHRQRISGFAATMVRAAEAAAASLEERRGRVVDMHHEMMRLTLRIVGETLLGFDPSAAADDVGAALHYLLSIANRRSSRILDLPPTLPTRENRRFQRALATLDAVVLRMIAERRRDPGDRGDLLSMLMEARDAETGESMDDRQLRDEAMTIFLAGHETTANALTFTWLLLSRYPAAFRELRAELAQALGGRSPGVDDLPRLTLTRRTLMEAMRLYPPAWIIGRSVNGADQIGGYEIPPRSILFLSPYVVHRHPRHWADPEGFDPGRFAQEPPRGAYFPFGGGPRMCIGNGFATMEAELVLATLAQRIRPELLSGYPVELEPSITLRPRYGVRMTIR